MTAVSISFAVPAKVIVEPVLTVSSVPVSAAIVNSLTTASQARVPVEFVLRKNPSVGDAGNV